MRAVFFTIVAFLPLLEAGNQKGNVAQSSQTIITSSLGAFNRVPMAHFAYGASKAAVLHMAKQLATAFVKYHIRFNVIAPGCKFFFLPCIRLILLFYHKDAREYFVKSRFEILTQPRSVSLRDDWLDRGTRKEIDSRGVCDAGSSAR